MECFKIRDLSFKYPAGEKRTLDGIDLTVNDGEFITLCGFSGCGKTTLLRLLKPSVSPYGELCGEILFKGKPLSSYDTATECRSIGFVLQNPDNQTVTDKVWHELAFGLESLGYSNAEIRTRVSEMASFFGIGAWFHKDVAELSGGQKQLLNLASVMVMQPSVLILDEPTSQLDPISAGEFLTTLEKINRELGTTVILTEHRLEDAFAISDRVVVMDNGRIIVDASPRTAGEALKNLGHDMYRAIPVPARVFHCVSDNGECPLTVREGKKWLEGYAKDNALSPESIPFRKASENNGEPYIRMSDVWFRYEKELPDVLRGMSLDVYRGEFLAIVGGNGAGKTTALTLMAGLGKPYRGKIYADGKDTSKSGGLCGGLAAMLPQDPQTLFVKKTVYLDLSDMLRDKKMTVSEKEARIYDIARLCRIEGLLDSHPYDLSGGEQQRAALAKVLLCEPRILLLDEPTKGMDASFKEEFANIMRDLKSNGVTVVAVSHDIEFCAEYADRCAMFFDGGITSEGEPRSFFAGKSFYTTSANRMARSHLPSAVTVNDIILACGKNIPERRKKDHNDSDSERQAKKEDNIKKAKKPSLTRIVFGCIFALIFALCLAVQLFGKESFAPISAEKSFTFLIQTASVLSFAASLICFFPQRSLGAGISVGKSSDGKMSRRTLAAALLILIAIPLTIYFGIYHLGDRRYYLISLLIMLETMIPFCMVFEKRKPLARELVIISVLCALSVASRAAFFMVPQFKPVVAMIILAGICFGGETGFLVGAVTGFVSNFFFGQGPWTPWQMFAFGIIGFIGGVIFKKGFIPRTRMALCIFGFTASVLIYGGIMNPASVIIAQSEPTVEMIVAAYAAGLPFDFVHALSTAFFLWFMAEPMIDKTERIKIKYGLMER